MIKKEKMNMPQKETLLTFEGLKKLEEVLLNYGNVYVVAPLTQQSRKACGISAFFGVCVNKIDNKIDNKIY